MSEQAAKELLASAPKTVRVGTFTYTVAVVDGLKDDEGDDQWGLCIHSKQSIQIDNGHATPLAAVDTIIHEIMHAIWDERGLGKKEPEERAIQALATGLTGVLQNNPKLMTWIRRGLKK